MSSEIPDFISKIRTNQKVKSFDEASTKQALILPILSYLGWDIFDTDEVTPEYSVENRRVDYSLRINNINRVFIEAKKTGEDLERHQEQLLEYSFRQGIELAILTNGITWWLYLPTEKGQWHERKFYTIDFYQQDSDDIEAKLQSILLKDNIKNGSAIAHARSIYSGKQKRKIVRESLPEAWNKLLTEPSPSLIELIAEASEKLCGFKPEQNEVKGFLETKSEEWIITDADIPLEDNAHAQIVEVQNEGGKPNFFKRDTGQRITQEELVPHILRVLHKHGGRARKSQVDEELYEKFKDIFEQEYYQKLVSHGVPRWQHFIAFAKESAKLNYGYIKRPDESGRGTWELTTEGTREAARLLGA